MFSRIILNRRFPRRAFFPLAGLLVWFAGCPFTRAEDNGLALSPPMGWSSWSSLLINVDESAIKAIAQIQASSLKSAGYVYVNVDAGWYLNPDLGIDSNGRWIADPSKFPSGMQALGDYIHSLGLKFGIYVTPGIPKLAVTQNTPVEGTPYHASDIAIPTQTEITYLGGTMYALDYTKPGAQEFVNSWANLFAAWGADYLKLDAAGDTNIPDIKAWSTALIQTGRPIHFELANNLDPSNAAVWRQYSNGWRISTDIESYNGTTLTDWDHVALRFALEPNWLAAPGPGGWNDLDSLEVGGAADGLSADERQSMLTFWALSASPLLVGDDLRGLDSLGMQLLTNPEVIKIDQNGLAAAPFNTASPQEVWAALEPDGSYAVGLFNLSSVAASIDVPWSSLGFTGAATVRDLWASVDLGSFQDAFSAAVNPHAARLLRIVPRENVLQRLAGTAVPGGGAFIGASTVGQGGQRAQSVGHGGTLTFPNVNLAPGGFYDLTISYVNGDETARKAILTVNGRESLYLNFPGAGDWAANVTEQGIATSIKMACGANTLVLANPAGAAPDIIGITLQPRLLFGVHPDCAPRQVPPRR